MNVVIVGGHGKIALQLEKLLAERGHSPRGIIRSTDQASDLEAIGAEPIVLDIENMEIDDAVAGAEVVVFAAGAGPGSGPARKQTVDFDGAVKLIKAAGSHGISRYLMVSAMGANRPDRWSDAMRPYYEAKAAADKQLMDSGLDYTIVRPGSLTDEPATGQVQVAEKLETRGSVTREDVAAVLAECMGADNTIGKAFDLLNDGTPVAEAVRSL
ncbi:MAG TPA: SDR family oxidoreductase [Solirubrobacterales bacterium]